jgi:hypothetical protein
MSESFVTFVLLWLRIFAACANFWDKILGCVRAKSAKGAKFRIIVFLIFFADFAFFARDFPILVAALPRCALRGEVDLSLEFGSFAENLRRPRKS